MQLKPYYDQVKPNVSHTSISAVAGIEEKSWIVEFNLGFLFMFLCSKFLDVKMKFLQQFIFSQA